jgi:hypothetical protein
MNGFHNFNRKGIHSPKNKPHLGKKDSSSNIIDNKKNSKDKKDGKSCKNTIEVLAHYGK